MKISPKTNRIVAKHWPLICGLIIGGLLGGITQSLALFLLFGAIGWAYFHFDFFHVPTGTHCAIPSQDDEFIDEMRDAMYRQSDEAYMAGAGIEPYASAHGYSTDD